MEATTSTARRTFLFTDIESSTRLWDQYPDAMLAALDRHDRILIDAVGSSNGTIIRNMGDGVIGAFTSAGDAVQAAISAQTALAGVEWHEVEPLRVRMGVHTGEVVMRAGEHHGWALNCASRLHGLAHGGQLVVSGAAMADVDPAVLQHVHFDDLGLHRLRDVAEPIRVYALNTDGSRVDIGGLRDTARKVAALPRSLTSFVGRTQELDLLAAEVDLHRLVTLTGVPGVGKSRLSVEVARRLSEQFADGVALCELGAVEPSQVGAALAKSLGVERRSLRSPEESIVEWMRDKELLVVLDGCEQATAAIGQLVRTITASTASAHVLATSHEPLSVDGERVVRLQPLDIDDAHAEAVELFLQRAHGAGADLLDDDRNRSLARSVCEAVAGLPLAIEIAASNAGSLSLLDIVEAVRAGELPGVSSAGQGRRSVADALDLTFDRLGGAARAAFARCAVFGGSFDRAAFAAVAAPGLDGSEVLEVLRTLVDRSLVTSETRRERTRFRLLEPVRAYAERRCEPADLDDARSLFVAHYVDAAEHAATSMRGPDEARWAAQIELDFDNLRAAHRRGLGQPQADGSLRIVSALWDFGFMHMRSEFFDWGEEAAAASTDHPLRAMVLGIVALGAWMREHPAKAVAFGEESLRLERESGSTPSVPARMALMNSAGYGGITVDVRQLMLEMLEVTRRSSSPYWQVNADGMRLLSLAFAGRIEQALDMAATVTATARQSQNPSTLAWASFLKGMAVEGVDVDHAEALFEDGLERARSVENGWIGAMCSTRLASLRRRRGSWADALAMLAELLDTWERAGHVAHLWDAVQQVALCLADAGDLSNAVVLHQAATSGELRAPKLPVELADDEACLARARSALGEAQWLRWAARATDLDQPAALALARRCLAAAITV